MRGRLFQGLQEGVERVARELVGFVDDVHLVLTLGRREPDLFAQVAHLVDTPVARGVDLDEVEEPPLADADAVLAGVARVTVLRLRAVHGLRDDPRDRCLADASRTGEEVRVGDLTVRDGVLEGPGDMLLTHDLGEGLRAVTAVEGDALRHAVRIKRGTPCTLRRSRHLGHARTPWLGPGLPAALSDDRLPLLPSGPDGVRGPLLHRTRSSTPRRASRSRDDGPREGIQSR